MCGMLWLAFALFSETACMYDLSALPMEGWQTLHGASSETLCSVEEY